MTPLEDRQRSAEWVEQARREGARLTAACEVAGIDARTLQRWKHRGLHSGDRRPDAARPTPAHALSAAERGQIVQIANEPRFAELPPARIVPMLADEGIYVASESSFSRVLKAHGQIHHRGRAKTPQRRKPPSTHVASAPRQLWCWDLTFLASQIMGQWFYLYLILDVYSRRSSASRFIRPTAPITLWSYCAEPPSPKGCTVWRTNRFCTGTTDRR